MFPTLSGYRASWLASDAVAGMMLAAIAAPAQLATAKLAGMPAISGLAALVAGSIGIAAFGSNRFMSVGADSTIAPIIAGSLATFAAAYTTHYASLAGLLALYIGVILVAAGALKLGWVADLLSVPVTTGFLAGIAVHVIVSQLPSLLGFGFAEGHIVRQIAEMIRRLPEARPAPLMIGLGVLVLVIVAAQISARIPAALIGMAASGAAVWALGLGPDEVATLGALPVAWPEPALSLPSLAEATRLVPDGIIIAVVCIMQTSAVAQSFPSDEDKPDDVSQDFAAVGFGSLIAILAGAFAVDASPPVTSVVKAAGGRTQAASLIAAALVVALVAFASKAFAYVPLAALSGVLIFVGIRIFRLNQMIDIARRSRYELGLVLVSAALVVLLPVPEGVTLAILLSLLHGVYIVARPDCVEYVHLPGTTSWLPAGEAPQGECLPGVVVFGPGAPIYFSNARAIGAQLSAIVEKRPDTKLVVIVGDGVIDLDYTGALTLKHTIDELSAKGVTVKIARLGSMRALRALTLTGLAERLGPNGVAGSTEEAVRAGREGKA